jgi:hypothetical protein
MAVERLIRVCHHRVMETFRVRLEESPSSPPQEPFGGVTEVGFRAPGRTILIWQEGSGWVASQDGTREAVEAKTVVIYESGEWIEYASDGKGDSFRAELYGAAAFSDEQQAARVTRFVEQATHD